MPLFRMAALVALALTLGGCATPSRISMTPEQRARITELKARVVVVQDEVMASVQASNLWMATGGGLIVMMIDNSITNWRVKASQDVMGPFYAQIEDVDYRQEFSAAVGRGLAGRAIRLSEITTTPRDLNQSDLTRLCDELQTGQALLVIRPRYSLTTDFRNLDIEAVVTLWTRESKANTPVQRSVLRYQSEAVGAGSKASIAVWGANDAARFRATLQESIAETIELVSAELDGAPGVKPGRASAAYAFNTGERAGQVKGQLVKETSTRWRVLGDDKVLYSLPKPSKLTAAKAP